MRRDCIPGVKGNKRARARIVLFSDRSIGFIIEYAVLVCVCKRRINVVAHRLCMLESSNPILIDLLGLDERVQFRAANGDE